MLYLWFTIQNFCHKVKSFVAHAVFMNRQKTTTLACFGPTTLQMFVWCIIFSLNFKNQVNYSSLRIGYFILNLTQPEICRAEWEEQ